MNRFESMTDEMLVMMYAQGTNAAFDTLLNRYKSSIHSYISNFNEKVSSSHGFIKNG